MRNLILATLSTLALLIYPLSLSAQNSFSVSVDVNSAAGDQVVTSVNTAPNQVVAIQIFGKDIQNANGLAVRFEYDASQVTYEGFDTGNVLPNAQALPEQGTGFVEIGMASLGSQATANSGLAGTVRFRTTAGFSGTAIRLVRAELGRSGRFETITLDVRVELKLQALTPDFNGDGVVNFADFLLFGGQFGARQGDGRYEAKYDLDSDGAIGFGDFLIFGKSFGKEVPPSGGNGSGGSGGSTIVDIPDANLRAAIETALGKTSGAPISRAEMAGLTVLEADNSNISDLTGLEFATGLTNLDLGRVYVSGEGNVNSNDISDLSPLSGLTSLTGLNLQDNSISDVTALSGLTNLRVLSLSNNFISDVNALSGLKSLTRLYLPDNLISNISPLSSLTNLTYLDLFDNLISDVTALSGLTNLTELRLNDNLIADVSALSKLTNLTVLHLDSNSISDVAALSGLTNLTELRLNDNLIADVSALSNLTNLTYLNLSNNLIADVSALSGLTNLTTLLLFSNLISDVAALSGLTNLTSLWLPGNLISDIRPLSNLTNLTSLWLDNNSISDVAALSGMTNLIFLGLDNNSISDVAALSGMTNLRWLELYNNNISDIAPLVTNTGLGSGDEVDVRNNPLSSISLNTHIPALQARGVDVRFGAGKPAVVDEQKSRMEGVLPEERGYNSLRR